MVLSVLPFSFLPPPPKKNLPWTPFVPGDGVEWYRNQVVFPSGNGVWCCAQLVETA